MDVILLEKIENLGDLGDKVSVKPGFARNHLIPKAKAKYATEENLKEFEEKYAKLQMYGDGGKDWTSIAQYASTLTRRNSEELKFYIWSVLAIVLIITVISNFKKKTA